MIKAYSILIISSVLLIAAGSADWLEGGYVGSGGSSEMSSYFTDPIFTSPAGSYLSRSCSEGDANILGPTDNSRGEPSVLRSRSEGDAGVNG